ncbi:Hydroperoxy fatty acid reductase [Coccomyxa sp. Obi]|nr:Hydroperoxy fatty acid reductase [Coccomyxa sp. Obi]
MRRASPLLPLHPPSGRRKRQDLQTNLKRTLLLAGIAIALIFGGLSLKKLTETRAKESLKVVEVPPARTHLLQEPYADLYVDKKKDDEPCGDSCSKDHAHTHAAPAGKKEESQVPFYFMTAEDIDGKEQSMRQYAGKVLLITNVASECGFTDSNYRGLQKLYEKFQSRGFEVLAFPCNQFGNQEPGDSQTIKEFAKNKYHVTFPLFKKVEVNGPHTHPIFKYLNILNSAETEPNAADWNFNKYLVGRDGYPIKHYASAFNEAELDADIEKALSAGKVADI